MLQVETTGINQPTTTTTTTTTTTSTMYDGYGGGDDDNYKYDKSFEKLKVARLVMKYLVSYGIWSVSVMFTRPCPQPAGSSSHPHILLL
jgi:hypothetical protein